MDKLHKHYNLRKYNRNSHACTSSRYQAAVSLPTWPGYKANIVDRENFPLKIMHVKNFVLIYFHGPFDPRNFFNG